MAKTIKIFLIDGEPNGLKTAELSNWVGQAIVSPRNKLKDIKQRPDCNKPAIYFLVGKENEEEYVKRGTKSYSVFISPKSFIDTERYFGFIKKDGLEVRISDIDKFVNSLEMKTTLYEVTV